MKPMDARTEIAALPLVSCIMPTCNRRAFVPHAIRYFLQQDYANRELVIVDDGNDNVEDIIPADERIRYIRIEKNMTLGEKRNFCVRESRGNLIMHWDDDDWMAPYRISYQVQELLLNNVEVCGLKQMLFYNYDSNKCWLYKYQDNSKPWLAGGSLLYSKDFWRKSPFPDMQVASDTQFIWSRKLNSYVALKDYNFYVATIHNNNTSPKITDSKVWHPIKPEIVQRILSEDRLLYSKSTVKKVEKILPDQLAPQRGKRFDNMVSVCLLSYKRPHNIQSIIDSLHDYDFVDEILVWNNQSGISLVLTGTKVRVINAAENMLCYGRVLCAGEAKNEIIYVQDDDAIVKNVAVLYNAFLKDSSRITHALGLNHYRQRDIYEHAAGKVALLGWGAFFKKCWLKSLDNFLLANKNDYLFRREADQIFTLSLGMQHNSIPASLQLLNHHSTPGIALYLEPDHNLHKAVAVNRALAFNRESKNATYPVMWNVVIPCKNYGRFLGEAVNSVLQNTADYVITIVDDNSNDNTKEISLALAAKYPFINYIKLNQNMGVSFARNKGIASVDSVFVVMLDADDKMGGRYLFTAEKILRQGFDVANPDAILFGNENARWDVPESVSLSMMLRKNYVHTSAAFRRGYWAQAGGIDENMHHWQDYEFWLRLAASGARIRRISGDHFFYRKHGFSKSSESRINRHSVAAYIKTKHIALYQSFGL
jgi:glycosyltransferase involved in cell wall biosynthesis